MELSWQRTPLEEMWNFSTCGRVVGCRELILSPTRPLPLFLLRILLKAQPGMTTASATSATVACVATMTWFR